MSTPIKIPPRNLSSSKPPQDSPFFSPPPTFPRDIPSSFDQYCGHFENAQNLRHQWKNNVRNYKHENQLNNKLKSHLPNTK